MARIRLTGGSYSKKRHSSRSSLFPRVKRKVTSSSKLPRKLTKPVKKVLINVVGEINITIDRAILIEKSPKSGFPTGNHWHWSANRGWVLKRPFHANEKDANTSITF